MENEEVKQIEIAYLLSKFIHWEEASSEENIIPELNGTVVVVGGGNTANGHYDHLA